MMVDDAADFHHLRLLSSEMFISFTFVHLGSFPFNQNNIFTLTSD